MVILIKEVSMEVMFLKLHVKLTKCSPATVAQLTEHLWSVEPIITTVMSLHGHPESNI